MTALSTSTTYGQRLRQNVTLAVSSTHFGSQLTAHRLNTGGVVGAHEEVGHQQSTCNVLDGESISPARPKNPLTMLRRRLAASHKGSPGLQDHPVLLTKALGRLTMQNSHVHLSFSLM